MSKKTNLPESEAFGHISDLIGEGQHPNTPKLRERFGQKGSFDVLQRFLDAWFARYGPSFAAKANDLERRSDTEAVAGELDKVYRRALAQFERDKAALSSALDAREHTLAIREDAVGRREQLLEERMAGQRELTDRLREEVAAATTEADHLRQLLGSSDVAAAAAAAECRVLRERLGSSEQTHAELRTEIDVRGQQIADLRATLSGKGDRLAAATAAMQLQDERLHAALAALRECQAQRAGDAHAAAQLQHALVQDVGVLSERVSTMVLELSGHGSSVAAIHAAVRDLGQLQSTGTDRLEAAVSALRQSVEDASAAVEALDPASWQEGRFEGVRAEIAGMHQSIESLLRAALSERK